MTPWQWWIGTYEDVECEGCYLLGPYPSRHEATAAGFQEWPGQLLCVIEARSSTSSKKHDDAPFLRTRNYEEVNPVMQDVLERAAKAADERARYWLDIAHKTAPPPWWAFWRTDVRDDYDSMASELNILADDIRDLI